MIISTDNGTARNLFGDVEALRMIRDAGFDGIDYTFYDMVPAYDILALPDTDRRALADDIAACAKEVGLTFPQAHAPYLYQLKESRDSKHYVDVIRSFEYCAHIGCKQMVIHTLKFPLSVKKDEVDRLNVEYLRSFLPYAEEFDVNIGVENLFLHDTKRACFFGQHGTPEEMNAFVDRLNSPRFVTCCDLGHCALTGCEPQDFIAGMSPDRLTMLHVQDLDYRDDRHWLPYAGKLDWEAITASLAKIGFRGSMNLEVLHFYDRFPQDLQADALRLAAKTARRLAGMVERGQQA